VSVSLRTAPYVNRTIRRSWYLATTRDILRFAGRPAPELTKVYNRV